MAALLEKIRRVFAHRYTPFFLPIVGSLLYIGLSILLVPNDLGARSDASADDESTDSASADASATPGSGALSPSNKRRARMAARAAVNIPGAVGVPGSPPVPMQPPPAPVPASPDGAD